MPVTREACWCPVTRRPIEGCLANPGVFLPLDTAEGGACTVTYIVCGPADEQTGAGKVTYVLDLMVGRDGFEPSTNWLKANCSTTELTAHSGRGF